jgi:uncharacterized OB-fold protein
MSELPLPEPSAESTPFWAAAKESRLVLPRCNACGSTWFPPTHACPSCGSTEHAWIAASGRGKVFSFVVVHRVYHPGFADKVPYVVAVIELDEGPRMLSNVVGIPPGEVRCDMPVRVTFKERRGDMTIPQFVPAEPRSDGHGGPVAPDRTQHES